MSNSANGAENEAIATAAKTNTASYLTKMPPEISPGRRLLEQYSGLAHEDVDAHIFAIRDKAWAVFPYGCIASFGFLNLTPTIQDSRFQAVLARLKTPESSEIFLEVGCCLGQIIRYLIAQGVSSDRLYGTDLQPGFLDFGHELFLDGDGTKSKATFVAGNMLQEDDANLNKLNGKVDVIYASDFFHQFERDDQIQAAKQMVGFLKTDNSKVMIFGRNEGPKIDGWEKYILDADSWRQMWDEVGVATGTRWETEMEVDSTETYSKVSFGVFRVLDTPT